MGVDAVQNQKTIEQIIKETSSKTSERNTGELGKDDFLNLLVTQLKYQDPLKPMEDKEFISQMAQFSSLEQMQNMNKSMEAMNAYSLIGKQVTASLIDSDTYEVEYVQGEVSNIRILSGNMYAVINGRDVPVERITTISEGGKASGGESLSKYTNLIGFIARGEVSDAETGERVKINGIVMEVVRHDGRSYAIMDGVKAQISEIITENPSADENFITEYLNENIGEVIEVKIVDRDSDKRVPIKARLREFTEDEFGTITAVFDEFEVEVGTIDRVVPTDGMTLEQAILMQILERLSGTEEEGEESPDESEVDSDEG